MLPEIFTLKDDFPPVAYDEWRTLAEADLAGAPFEQKLVTRAYEGFDIQPLFTRRDHSGEGDPEGFPGWPPFVRGSQTLGVVASGWDLRQEHAHPDLATTSRAIFDDLQGGVTSLLVRLDFAARCGFDPDEPAAGELAGRDGVMAYHVDDLGAVLHGADLRQVGVALEAGAAFLPAAATLAAFWSRENVSLRHVRGAFNADPLAVLARDGELPMSPASALSQLADLALWTSIHCPQVTAVRAGTAPYHHAGATAVQDIAFGVASGIEYLRAMTGAGLDVDSAARQILFSISLGTHHFLGIAKLRAARRLWSRVVEASGGSPTAGAMQVHARTSKRVLTQRDAYVNILRNTAAVFAAGIGGAEVVTSVPFDAACGLPDDFSRRLARNTVLVLQDEAHLHRVIDPAGGSWYLDWLTDKIAEVAWGNVQEIERLGGMLAAMQSGWVAREIGSAFAPRAKDIARRKEGITGVSDFPDLREERIIHPPLDLAALRDAACLRVAGLRRESSALLKLKGLAADASDRTASAILAASAGASIGQLSAALGFHEEQRSAIAPLAPHAFAQPFEELRDASDEWQAKHGRRPGVFLANLGSAAHYTARAAYAKGFFEAGGFEVIGAGGAGGSGDVDAVARALAESGAKIAVICSSDKLYPEVVPQVAPRLKAAGARTVVLAGNPGANKESWQQAGVDRFIFVKCDVLATLREILCEQGVLSS